MLWNIIPQSRSGRRGCTTQVAQRHSLRSATLALLGDTPTRSLGDRIMVRPYRTRSCTAHIAHTPIRFIPQSPSSRRRNRHYCLSSIFPAEVPRGSMGQRRVAATPLLNKHSFVDVELGQERPPSLFETFLPHTWDIFRDHCMVQNSAHSLKTSTRYRLARLDMSVEKEKSMASHGS